MELAGRALNIADICSFELHSMHAEEGVDDAECGVLTKPAQVDTATEEELSFLINP